VLRPVHGKPLLQTIEKTVPYSLTIKSKGGTGHYVIKIKEIIVVNFVHATCC